MIAKIEWHRGELVPRIGFVVPNSRLPVGKVIKVCNGRAERENRTKEGRNPGLKGWRATFWVNAYCFCSGQYAIINHIK
jgi:hypothetical protein